MNKTAERHQLDDPGRTYRRILRGAFFVFVGMLFLTQMLESQSILREIRDQMELVWGVGNSELSDALRLTDSTPTWMWLFKIYNCSFATVYLCTPLLAVLASPKRKLVNYRTYFLVIALCFWATGLIPPLSFAVYHLLSIGLSVASVSAWILVILHVAVGVALLMRGLTCHDAQYVFWLGSYAMIAIVVGFIGLFAMQLNQSALSSGPGVIAMLALALTIAFSGVWLAWWHAVRMSASTKDT